MRTKVTPILLAAFVLTACASKEPYVFRSQDRPTYQNSINVVELRALSGDPKVKVLDVRLLEDYQAQPTLIPGATYMNPENIEAWASTLPADATVVVYCIAGRWVSQKAATYLDQQGIETYSLQGGIEAWQETQ